MFKSSSLVILLGIINHRVMDFFLGKVPRVERVVLHFALHLSSILSINSAHYAFGMVHPL